MRYLLDTNICIHLMDRTEPAVQARFAELNDGDVVMSAITYAELRAGIERNAELRKVALPVLDKLVQRVPVVPFGEQDAERYGVLRAARPERKRHAMDRLIAAHAVSMGLTLVTNNEADFSGYPGLKVENWVRG
jgi:tRNA(fMet)-specific endonuclease VapC